MTNKQSDIYDYIPAYSDTNRQTPAAHSATGKATSDNCKPDYTAFPKNISNAIAYVAFQLNSDGYNEDEAFNKGTLFPVLYKPFEGKGVGKQ